MSYTLFTNIKAKSVSYGSTRTAASIKYIVIHYTSNKTDKAKSNATYYRDTNKRAAGAHYFVDATSVYQSIDDLRIAWSVGGSKLSTCAKTGGGTMHGKVTNANSISIELCSTNGAIAAETIANAVALTKSLMSKYKISASNVYRHFDVTGKLCPGWSGWYGSDSSKWDAFKSQLASGSSAAGSYVSNGVDYSKVFDPTFYANNQADVKKAFGTDASLLFKHFIANGMSEGRQAIATFNVNVYKANNADLVKAYGDSLPDYYKHYCIYGYKEGRKAY